MDTHTHTTHRPYLIRIPSVQSGETEVGDLQVTVFVQQEVFGLEIAMANTLLLLLRKRPPERAEQNKDRYTMQNMAGNL